MLNFVRYLVQPQGRRSHRMCGAVRALDGHIHYEQIGPRTENSTDKTIEAALGDL